MGIKNFVSKVFGRVAHEITLSSAEETGSRKPAKLVDKQQPQGFYDNTRAEVSKLNAEIELAQIQKKHLEERISRASAELEDIEDIELAQTRKKHLEERISRASAELEQIERTGSFLDSPETQEEQLLETKPISRREPRTRRRKRRLPSLPKKTRSLMGLLLSLLAVLIVLFGLIRPFIVEAFYVPSESMVPTLEVGDRVLVNKFIYRFAGPERGHIVVFEVETASGAEEHLVKRVVGLPGDEIAVREGVLLVNGVPQKEAYLNPALPDESSFGPIEVPPEHVFVMGDNRARSADSRFIGPVPETEIAGKVILRVWPPNRLRLF
jgi:signal peptidase I